jgi:hypothetical protein
MEAIDWLSGVWGHLPSWLRTTIVITLAVLVGISTLLTLLIPAMQKRGVRVPTWLVLVADVLAFLPRPGKWGVLLIANAPLVPSFGQRKPKDADEKPVEPPISGAAVVLVLAAIGMMLAGAGCGGATTAYRVIDSATALGRTGFDLVHEIDKEKQDAIADEKDRTGDVEAAKAKLREWREKRDKARAALKTYAAAVATAGATLDLVVAGQEKRLTIGMVLAEVAKAIAQIKSVLEAFGVKVPLLSGVPPDEAARIAARGFGWVVGKLAHAGGAR